jgi:molybdenum cofactor cytidylyltransferase
LFVAGLVLAAGGARCLGRPKQLLAFNGGTMLGHVVDSARACAFDQLVVAIGGYADAIRDSVDLRGVDIAFNPAYGEGRSSSVVAALDVIDPRADTLVLLLGDQPGVTAGTVATLLAGAGDAPLAACAYDDGRGHPLAFRREMFGELAALHGEKAVWKLLDRHADDVVEVPVQGRVPRDVDTAEDYAAVLAESARGR